MNSTSGGNAANWTLNCGRHGYGWMVTTTTSATAILTVTPAPRPPDPDGVLVRTRR